MTGSNDAWGGFRRVRNIVWLAFLGYVPIVAFIAFVSVRLFSTLTPAFIAAFAWMGFFLIAGNLFIRFPCPRCGKPFFSKWWYYNSFARRCVHCGLKKYAELGIASEK
jgi:hypothetical protein